MKKTKLAGALVISVGFLTLVGLLVLLRWLSNSRFTFVSSSAPRPYDPYEYFYDGGVVIPADAGPYVDLFSTPNLQGTPIATLTSSVATVPSALTNTYSLDMGPYTRATLTDVQGVETVTYENNHDFVLQVPQFSDTPVAGNLGSVRLEIITPYAIVYTEPNLGGYSKILSGNTPNLDATWANNIVSMIIAPYAKVTLYDTPGFSVVGNSKTFSNNGGTRMTVKYVGTQMESAVQSVKVEALFAL